MNKDIQKQLAETLQGAFPGIPVYTGETMDNERNEHFKGFAKLLWDDLYQVAGALMVDTTPHEWDEIIAQLKILIAQRAYDLMEHIMLYAPAAPVPDMTEWPKTASE